MIDPNEIKDVENNSDKKAMAFMEQMNLKMASGKEAPKSQFADIRIDDANYWEVTDIPTKYKLYPVGTHIMVRPLKVLDVKKLTSMSEENAEYVIRDILRKCVRGIDINELYSADKIYMIFWLRANSFRDNRYVVDFVCEKCDSDSEYHFDLGNIRINYIEDSYDPYKIITVSTGDEITLGMLKIKDEIEMENFKQRYQQMFANSEEGIDDNILNLSFLINTINGKQYDPLHKYQYCVDSLSAGDFSTLTTYIMNTSIGVDPIMTIKCQKCGGESLMGLTFHPDFLFPKDSAK